MYRSFGVLRERGDCLEKDYEVWFGGYPRSANTFSIASFHLANPNVRIARHWHIPTFIINAVRLGKPGILHMRRPEDSVISWTIFWRGQHELADSLDYYIDFHRALLPYREKIFVAVFEQIIHEFDSVMREFNGRFGTDYAEPEPSQRAADARMAIIEDRFRGADGVINEHMVSRPSEKRAKLKGSLLAQLHESKVLRRKLGVADELYREFTELSRDSEALYPTSSTVGEARSNFGI
jgi:hypothetical protein